MVGTSAHGRLYRYRYYVCLDRHSYGRHGCTARRLGADRTEDAILNGLLQTYEKPGLIRAAMARATEKRAAGQPKVAQELAAVAADINRAQDAIKRYQVAFEGGTMQPEDCGPRLQELGNQLRDLRSREAELELARTDQAVPEITDEWIAEIHDEIVATLNEGSPAKKKALLKRLIVDVDIDEEVAYPKYRVPTAGVRIVELW